MKTIFNKTQDMIQMEINQVLKDYQHHPSQQLFFNSDRCQDLEDYVLDHLNSVHSSIDSEMNSRRGNDRCTFPQTTRFPMPIKLTIEALIHRGIQVILNRNSAIHEIT
jgi:hypothetical protein